MILLRVEIGLNKYKFHLTCSFINFLQIICTTTASEPIV